MYKVKKLPLTLLITAVIVILVCIFFAPRIISVVAGPGMMLLIVISILALGGASIQGLATYDQIKSILAL